MRAKEFIRLIRCGRVVSAQFRTWGETYRFLDAVRRHGGDVSWFGNGYIVRADGPARALAFGSVTVPMTEDARVSAA